MKELELQRKSLPNEPGVYLFLDIAKSIIYVGKALNLKKRVNQYFLKSSYIDPYYEEKIKELVKAFIPLNTLLLKMKKKHCS